MSKYREFPPREALARHLYLQQLAIDEAEREIEEARRQEAALDLEEEADDRAAQKETQEHE